MTHALLVGILSEMIFLLYQVTGIYTGDSGDVVTAAAVMGVAHPPGYPLYTLLGYLLTHIPLFTVSWRVTLLSSLSHAFVVGIVYFLVHRITKKTFPALLAAWILALNYLFFLYSITPEVFALFDAFVAIFFLLVYQYTQTKQQQYVFWMCFVFGLSLTNHHLMLFFFPVFGYCVYTSIGKHPKALAIGVVLFLLGLLPYVYVPYAASLHPIINWDGANTISNFVRLITRADYGSFISNSSFRPQFGLRLLGVWGYVLHIASDFSFVGVGLFVVGCIALWQKARNFASLIFLGLFLVGPLFIFYASFPLMSNYGLGTFERFLLPSYFIIALGIGVGFSTVLEWVSHFLRIRASGRQYNVLILLFLLVVLVYPLSISYKTLWRFEGMARDKTANNLGMDFLDSVPMGSLLVMGGDTSLFVTQYIRYAEKYRPDVVLIHASRLPQEEYRNTIMNLFPLLIMPEFDNAIAVSEFIKENSKSIRTFSNTIFPVGEGYVWVPYGLVFEITHVNNAPEFEQTIEKNNILWSNYHDPNSGILSRFDHLMLSDILDVYANARIEFGAMLARASRFDEARVQFEHAVALRGNTSLARGFEQLGLSFHSLGRCDDALAAFDNSGNTIAGDTHALLLYTAITYRDCVKDATAAAELFEKYEQENQKKETLLEQL